MKASMLISRSIWEAREPKYPVTMTDHKDLFIAHHAAANGPWPTQEDERAQMRAWQQYHMRTGADIYYGAVIFPSGRAYEGRYGGWFANNGGAYGCNVRGFGVCMAGNFNGHAPTTAALDTLVHLALEAHGVFGLAPDRYWGHRDCAAYDSRNRGNDCPGEVLYNWLPALRNIVAGGEEEEEMRRFQQVGLNIYNCPRVFGGDTLFVHLEWDKDAELDCYFLPFSGAPVQSQKINAGGWLNKSKWYGNNIKVSDIFPGATEGRMTIHSPAPLAIEVG